ncbi:MAG TPA: hypothetical protein VKH35_15455 [Thermoanaerobaculia bacterium]|nr:hypothetical protein [Thermoanaerobaculia bacterium]
MSNEHELQRIDVEEDDEQGDVQGEGGAVLKGVAAKELLVIEPDGDEHENAAGERKKPPWST